MATERPLPFPAPSRGPRLEPDRSVWRLLCFAGESPVSDEQIHAAFPAFSRESIAAARARVADEVGEEARRPEALTLQELAEAASVTLREVLAAGLPPSGSGWAGLILQTPAEHAAFFGPGTCAPTI